VRLFPFTVPAAKDTDAVARRLKTNVITKIIRLDFKPVLFALIAFFIESIFPLSTFLIFATWLVGRKIRKE
jgi:hypothetical protein